MPVGRTKHPSGLRAGPLLTLLLLLAGGAPAEARDGKTPVDVELVLAVDISYSMDTKEQHLQRAGYVEALKSREFLAALQSGPLGRIAIRYIQWASADDQDTLLDWTLIDSAESAAKAADSLAEAPYRRASRTSISGGIDAAVKSFENNGFAGARRIVDVSGDGPNNNGRPVTAARDDAIAAGIAINGLPLVGIRTRHGPADIRDLDLYYDDCVIGGPDSFMIVIHDVSDFIVATRTKLVREIASAPEKEAVQPVSAREPRISCTIGENLWQHMWGN